MSYQAAQPDYSGRRPEPLGYARSLFEGDPSERATLTPAQRELFEQVLAKRAELRQAKKEGRWSKDLLDMAAFQVAERYYLRQREIVEQEIEPGIRKAEAKWRAGREPVKELLALERYKIRYGAMGPKEVEAEIERYAKAPAGWEPIEVEALLAAAVRSGSGAVDTLRQTMRKARYDEPWRTDVPELVALEGLYSAPFGQVRLVTPFGVDEVLIAELLSDDRETDGEGFIRQGGDGS